MVGKRGAVNRAGEGLRRYGAFTQVDDGSC